MGNDDNRTTASWHQTSDRQDTEAVKHDYEILVGLANNLTAEIEDALSEEHAVPKEGFSYFHLMCGLFLVNQLHYLEDLVLLAPGRSTEVIGRTMVEGLIKLSWVEEDSAKRSSRWFNYFWFQELKTLARLEARGEDVSNDKATLLVQLLDRALIHLNDDGNKALESGEALNPFGHFKSDWTGKSTYDLTRTPDLKNIYSRFFDPYNDWVHWSAKGLLKCSDTSGVGINYTYRSYYQSVSSLIAGITSLLGCLKIWLRAFELEVPKNVKALEDAFRPYSPANK